MIRNLRIRHPTKNLPSTDLEGFGRVTVVCGRNNSGKTTLLEAIRDLDPNPDRKNKSSGPSGSLTYRLEGEMATTVWAAVKAECDPRHWDFTTAQRIVKRAWGDTVVGADSVGEVVGGIGKFMGYSNLQQCVSNAVSQRLRRVPTRVLVPAKRLRSEGGPIDAEASDELEPDGRNLLNYLFASKNQEEGSERHRYYGTLRSTFAVVTGGFDFNVTFDRGDLSLGFKPGGSVGWGPADSFGLGLQDVLLILAVALSHDGATVLVEEPENHVHPAMQRRLLQVLKGETSNQYVISTHSNVFLDNAFVDRIFFSEFVDGEIRVGDVTSKASLLDDLGYEVTDNLTADVVVLVEGPTDVPVLETLALKRDDLRLKQFKFWPLGGDIMDQLDLTVLSDSNNILALVDDDPGSKRVRDRFVAKCEELGIPYHRLERYAIENYFTVDALREVYGGQFPDHVAKVTPRTKLEKQLGFNVKRRNRAIAEAMSYSDIEGTDLDAFFDLMAAVAR